MCVPNTNASVDFLTMRLPGDIGEAAVYLALQPPEILTGAMVSASDYDQEHGIRRATTYNEPRPTRGSTLKDFEFQELWGTTAQTFGRWIN